MGLVGVIYETVLAAELEPALAGFVTTATRAAALPVARRIESMMNLVLVNIVRAG
jgi:hypothetical protein